MADEGWSVVATLGDRISAQALLGLLESEGLRCMIVSNGAIPGLGTEFAVLVPAELLRKAQSIRQHSGATAEELTYLATGEPPGEAKDS